MALIRIAESARAYGGDHKCGFAPSAASTDASMSSRLTESTPNRRRLNT
jgi:hypothetical protein